MYLLQRLAFMVLVVWLAATLAFFMLRVLPGDAIQAQLARGGVSATVIEARRAEQGLTDPVVIQYGRFLTQALQGNLGYSLLTREPVTQMLLRDLYPTFELALSALVVASGLGLLLGVAGALDLCWGVSSVARLLTSLSLSTPVYWTGTLAIYLFTVVLGLLPSAGAGRLSQLILPVAILGFHVAGAIARMIQVSVRQAMNADFVRTARGKGLPETQVIARHALRVGLLPAISVTALQAGFLLSGTVIVETLFVRPGIGRLLLNSTIQQDYPVVQGVVLLSALVYVIVNTLADALTSVFDPRVAIQ